MVRLRHSEAAGYLLAQLPNWQVLPEHVASPTPQHVTVSALHGMMREPPKSCSNLLPAAAGTSGPFLLMTDVHIAAAVAEDNLG